MEYIFLPRNKQAAYYIYFLRNKITGKIYVGQTCEPRVRAWGHKGQIQKGKHQNKNIRADAVTHGIESFIFIVIAEAKTWYESQEREARFINMIRAKSPDALYNIALPTIAQPPAPPRVASAAPTKRTIPLSERSTTDGPITLQHFHAILADAGVDISHSHLKVLARQGAFPVIALGEGKEKRYYVADIAEAQAAIPAKYHTNKCPETQHIPAFH